MEIGFRVVLLQTEEFEDIGVFEEFHGLRMDFSQRC
jgi:hypothetical protein